MAIYLLPWFSEDSGSEIPDFGRLCIDTDTAGGLFFGDSGFAVTLSGIDSINPLTLDIGVMAGSQVIGGSRWGGWGHPRYI